VPIHVFTVGYCKDTHDLVVVIDTVDNPIVATGNTVPVLMTRAHLPAAVRARVSLEVFDGFANLLVGVRGTPANLFQHLLEMTRGIVYSDFIHCFSFVFKFLD
jgi:hypothetical protein